MQGADLELRFLDPISSHLDAPYFACDLLRQLRSADAQRILVFTYESKYCFFSVFFGNERSGLRVSISREFCFFASKHIELLPVLFGFPAIGLRLAAMVVVVGRLQPIGVVGAYFTTLVCNYAGWTKYCCL